MTVLRSTQVHDEADPKIAFGLELLGFERASNREQIKHSRECRVCIEIFEQKVERPGVNRWMMIHNGNRGAGIMGADYGLFCTRCCWVMMAGLLTVGAMSPPLMGVFSIIIFLEKIVPFGSVISKLVGAGFIGTGLFLLV